MKLATLLLIVGGFLVSSGQCYGQEENGDKGAKGQDVKNQISSSKQKVIKKKLVDSEKNEFEIQFLEYVPKSKNNKKHPLILFLHGAGERGTKIEKVKFWGPPKMIEKGHEFPAIVISPQCPSGTWWKANQLKALLDERIKSHNVDKNRIYVTGLSMGGYGTWGLLGKYPNLFAAAIPICGGGKPETAKAFAKVPVWAFHGDKDRVVPISGTRNMVDAMTKAGGKPKFTVLKNVGHNSWSAAYKDKETFKWLFKQVKKSEKK